MTIYETGTIRKLDIGQVIGDALRVVGRRAPLLFGLTLVLSWLPSLVNSYFGLQAVTAATTPVRTGFPFTPQYHFSPSYAVGGIIVGLLGMIVLSCQVYIVASDLEGRPPALDEVLRRGLYKFLPVLLLMILWGVGVGVGLLLLIVPGLILMTMWSVALPAIVMEGSNPIDAFGRSLELTEDNRWRVFGLLCLVLVGMLIVQGLVSAAAMAAFGLPTGGRSIGYLAVTTLTGTVVSVVVNAILSALYVQLRGVNQGLGGATAAEVFA